MAASSADDVVVDSLPGDPVVDTTSTPNSDATPAASSTADTTPAETLLDGVKSTLAKPGNSPPTETPGSPAVVDPKAVPTVESDELPIDEARTLHPKTKIRFEKLTSDLKTSRSENETLKPKAAEYDKIETFVRNAGLTQQDVGSTLQIAAMLRSDPKGARERLQPIMAELDRILGETLPPALQARVDQGMLTLEDAQALNRAAASASLATRQIGEMTERQRHEETSRTQQAAVDATLNALDTWEKTKAKGDPDWQQKRDEVAELVELAIERKSRETKTNYWPTPDEMLKLSEDALTKIGDRYKRFAPKPRAVNGPVTAGASPRSNVAPKNTMDIIRRTVSGQFAAG